MHYSCYESLGRSAVFSKMPRDFNKVTMDNNHSISQILEGNIIQRYK